MKDLIERLDTIVEERRPRRPRRARGPRVNDRTADHINKKMDDEVYKLRRAAMEYIYRAKKLLKSKLGVEMPRITIRVTDLSEPESRILASARLHQNIVWVTEDAATRPAAVLHEIVFHELVHAIFGEGHYDSCKLMSPYINKKPLSATTIDKLFMKYAQKFYR